MSPGRRKPPSSAPPAARRAKRTPRAEPEEDSSPEAEALEPEEVTPELLDEGPVRRAALVPAKEPSVARRESLSQYMSEVGSHALLTREEELALAHRYRDTGDLRAAYRLVAANLRLVVKLAHEYHRNPLSLLDLIQEGNIGLMQAVKKYDPDRGVKLSSYAAWWIRAYILRYIMDNWKMVKLGTTEAQRKLFFKLRQEQQRLLAQGFEASPKLLAERLNVTEQDVVEMDQRLGRDELSLDVPLNEDGDVTRADRLPSTANTPVDEALGNEQLQKLFHEKLTEFGVTIRDEKERYIFEKRLTAADEPLTLQQIGDRYKLSRERARQIEAGLISRLREFMRQHIPDFDLVAAPKD